MTSHSTILTMCIINEKEIKSAIKSNIDIGLIKVLPRYQYKLHGVAMPLYLSTNTIVSLYSKNNMPAMITRQLILKTVNVLKPIKQTFLQVLK